MLSWPPATTIALSPVRTCWAASATARRPEPQTWLMPKAVFSSGMPAARAAWRAGVLALACTEHLAKDHLVHVGRREAGTRDCGLDCHGAEHVGRHGAERAVEA